MELPQPEARMFDVDGHRLYVATQNLQPGRVPLLVLNGLGASLELLQPFIDALGPTVATIRVDVPGVGRSPGTAAWLRFTGLARLLRQLLAKLDQPVVDVLGISWGGALAQQYAHQYPGHCRRLVLVSTGTGAIMVPGRPSVLAHLATPRRYFDRDYMGRIAGEIYGGKLRHDQALADRIGRAIGSAVGGNRSGYYGQVLAGVGWTSVHWLPFLRQPTLVLAGTDDPLVPMLNAKLMALLIPNSRLHLFDDGHLGIVTSAEEVAPVIRSFLSEGSDRRSAA